VFRNVLGQAGDVQLPQDHVDHAVLGAAHRLHRHRGLQLLIHGHRLEIHVLDGAVHRIPLQLLDEDLVAGGTVAVVQLQFNEPMGAGALDQPFQLPRVHGHRRRPLAAAV